MKEAQDKKEQASEDKKEDNEEEEDDDEDAEEEELVPPPVEVRYDSFFRCVQSNFNVYFSCFAGTRPR